MRQVRLKAHMMEEADARKKAKRTGKKPPPPDGDADTAGTPATSEAEPAKSATAERAHLTGAGLTSETI